MRIRISMVVPTVLLSMSASGAAVDYTESRQRTAKQALQEVDEQRVDVKGDHFMLFTLKQTLSGDELLRHAQSSRVSLTAVHICAQGGGVMSLQLNTAQDPATQLREAGKSGNAEALARLHANSASVVGATTASVQPTFSSSDSYCGFEAQGTYEVLRRLRERITDITYMVEITTRRRRMFPANLIN